MPGAYRAQPDRNMLVSLQPLIPFAIAFGASGLVCWLVVHTRDFHLHVTGDHPDHGPQKIHAIPTPRIGGAAILAGQALGLLYAALADAGGGWHPDDGVTPWLGLALAPLFALGLLEDLRKATSIRVRLMVSFVSGALVWWLAGVRVTSLGLPFFDLLLGVSPVFSAVFTMFAIGGLVHAMNIVDGLHGLLAGISLAILGALALVAWRVGDPAVLALALLAMASMAGFALLNFPRGRLFCGDAGAYLAGFQIAVLAILLVQRHVGVSPWFALAVVIHPVTETLYSAWRRVRQGLRATHPDALHLHSLWASRLEQRASGAGRPVWLGPNAGGAVRTVALAAVPSMLAGFWYGQALPLMLICAGYVLVFLSVLRWLGAEESAPEPSPRLPEERLGRSVS
jgi:UDP-N-acetylmuramyl pentapeptide phosphotransferase/UDP-N-acetylglucosamine-1-phosphate transferase